MSLTKPFTVEQKYAAFEWLKTTDFGSDEANLNALIMARELEDPFTEELFIGELE